MQRHRAIRLARSRRSRPGPVGYRLAKSVLSPALRALYDIRVQGLANVPSEEPVILVANHRSFMDSIFLAVASPRPVTFIAKAEYFDRRSTRWMFTSTGQIPLRRGSPAGAREALAAASDVLTSGGLVGIFPEGTRSRDGMLHRGNPGPARLALATGAAIVPAGLIGTNEVQSPDERMPHPFRSVTVRFGHPRWMPPRTPPRSALRRVTDDMMMDIAALCGQEYVDSYAPVPAPVG
jgi:1-acyl-sn-glycerol-3-phosphate acyltransferase